MLEHKSQSRRLDALQILDQVVAVLRTHRREHPRDRFLPALLPVVLHADTRPWRSPRNVCGLFDLARIPKPLQRYLPSLHYVLDDLHDVPPERLRRRAEARAEVQVSTLLRQITRRFGTPGSDVVARVRNGAPEELDRWLDRILDATSVADLFAE